ncbi:MAG: hypothetical protein WAV47_14015 [Blastocatellia bacterium]
MSTDTQTSSQPTRVTVDEVFERMNRGEKFTILDNRNPNAWGKADTKLPGAMRVTADDVEQSLGKILRDRTVITYCT